MQRTVFTCKSCNKLINSNERVYSIDFQNFHLTCFRCSRCLVLIGPACYIGTDKKYYCKTHYFENFGPHCGICMKFLQPEDLIRRGDNGSNGFEYFHISCLTCTFCHCAVTATDPIYVITAWTKHYKRVILCEKDFMDCKMSCQQQQPNVQSLDERSKKGDGEFKQVADTITPVHKMLSSDKPIIDKNELLAIINDSSKDDSTKKKFNRTKIANNQTNLLIETFRVCPRPDRALRLRLADILTLPEKTIQVWFQNRRSKLRKYNETISRSDITDEEIPNFRSQNVTNDNIKIRSVIFSKSLSSETANKSFVNEICSNDKLDSAES
ncbi:hypothetical protein ACOME3_010239 [Neoechinorhynchus agilis]